MVDRPSEFDLIAEFFRPLASGHAAALDLRDDAAVLAGPAADREQAITMDALVAGVHLFPNDSPRSIAMKVLGVNLSDLAAMGATPDAYTLAAAWPADMSRDWLEKFVEGLAWMQAQHGIHLVGGDTVSTSGPLSFTVTAFGTVARGRALRRCNAQPDDALYVSGTIGDAALGLRILSGDMPVELSDTARRHLSRRYHEPEPRTTLGPALIGLANSAIDISDGLHADAGHLAVESGQRISVDVSDLPLSEAAREAVQAAPELIATVCSGGDDYELAFSVPGENATQIDALSASCGVRLSRIGKVTTPNGEGPGVDVIDRDGSPLDLPYAGFQHF